METGTKSLGRFPETQQEADEAAQLLAEEMKQLSLEERERNMFDVHGLEQLQDEDPEDTDRYIDELEELVSKTPEKQAYEKAQYFDKNYVHDKNFLLMFLRSDRFDTKKAVKRLVRHFQVKERLFGSGEILGRDIRLSDMSEEDMLILESGCMQVMPRRDLAGRSVFSSFMMQRPEGVTLMGYNRVSWYMHTSTLNDEETQKKGVVGVIFNIGPQAKPDTNMVITQLDPILPALPKKLKGVHYCFDDDSLLPYVTGVHLFLDTALKGKFRAHYGDDTKFMLQTYGIPTSDQPIHPNGDISLAWHREWLNVRRVQEENEGVVDGEIVPRRFDVLFGRAKGAREHTGNLRAVYIVEMFQEQYEEANSIKKTEIASRVVAIVQESLGRFLKWEDGGWVEVSDAVARDKVSHFFRHSRTKRISRNGDAPQVKRVIPPTTCAVDRDKVPKHVRAENAALAELDCDG